MPEQATRTGFGKRFGGGQEASSAADEEMATRGDQADPAATIP